MCICLCDFAADQCAIMCAGLLEQLYVACSEFMKDVALSKHCAYMEAKHTGDKVLLEHVTQDNDAGSQVQITVRWKPKCGQVLFTVLEQVHKLIKHHVFLPHCIEIYTADELDWQLLDQAKPTLLPAKVKPWFEEFTLDCLEVSGVRVDVGVTIDLFQAIVELQGLTRPKSTTEQLPVQLVKLCIQLAQCGCTASVLYATQVTEQRRCVLSFLVQCIEIGALGSAGTERDAIKAIKQAYDQSKATGSEFGISALCAQLAVADIGAEFPGVSFPSSGHPLRNHAVKARLLRLYNDAKSLQPAQQIAALLSHHTPVSPTELAEALCVTNPVMLQQLLNRAVPDWHFMTNEEQDKIKGLLSRMQQRLKDVLAPLTYCWFHAEFGDGFLIELCQPEYFIGKSVAPHMTNRVQSWDPAACMQLQLSQKLHDVFKARFQSAEEYTTLRVPLSYALETRHLSAHQPHSVTVPRVLQLREHSYTIVVAMGRAAQHAETVPELIAAELEDAAVATFVQSHHTSTMSALAAKVARELDEMKDTMDAVLQWQPHCQDSAIESTPMGNDGARGENRSMQKSTIEECWERLCAVPAAAEEMAELGVEEADDLNELDPADVIKLGAMIKKVQRNKLIKALGMSNRA